MAEPRSYRLADVAHGVGADLETVRTVKPIEESLAATSLPQRQRRYEPYN